MRVTAARQSRVILRLRILFLVPLIRCLRSDGIHHAQRRAARTRCAAMTCVKTICAPP